jgi:hypothetical protein
MVGQRANDQGRAIDQRRTRMVGQREKERGFEKKEEEEERKRQRWWKKEEGERATKGMAVENRRLLSGLA